MIEGTCSACGTVNRIAEADLPFGAKYFACTTCKARVAVPAQAQAAVQPPPLAASKFQIPAIPKPGANVEIADLPAPKPKLSAVPKPPKNPTPAQPMPPTRMGGNGDDLPAPKSKALDDLPAPKGPVGSAKPLELDMSDLPAPKPKLTPVPRGARPADLPMPKQADLPAPKQVIADLPTPKADLPTPKAELPMLKHADLPAPKTFGAKPAAPAPAPVMPLAAPALDLDVPDLPAPKPGANYDLPAPKGFFDDLPQPAQRTSNGFFDDLPQPVEAVVPRTDSFDIDIGSADSMASQLTTELEVSHATQLEPHRSSSHELSSASQHRANEPMELEPGLGDLPPLELELDPSQLAPPAPKPAAAPPKPSSPADFADLDLSSPTEFPSATARVAAQKPPASPPPKPAVAAKRQNALESTATNNLALDLEDEDRSRIRLAQAKAQRRADTVKPMLAGQEADAQARRTRNRRIVLGGLLVLAIAGAGGTYMYKRHVAQKERDEQVATHLRGARAEVHSSKLGHWGRAATEATEVLEIDPKNLDAMGVRSEALLGGVLDTGIGGDLKIAQGKKVLGDALEAGLTGPQLDAAQALAMIASRQADRAVQKLQAMVQREPKNGFWQLYLGWALVAKGDQAAAVKAFDAAIADEPTVKIPALYARGRAKLLLVDPDGAKADFKAVLDAQKDHIGAQVGLAAAMPAAQAAQRETDLMAILARKDLGGGDPRAVVLAWTLAADTARQTGRTDVARERYNKALALAKNDVPALVGLASTDLADNRLDPAAEEVQKVLAIQPDSAAAQLVAADLAVHQGKLDDALAIQQKLAARQPPLPPLQRTQLAVVYGSILAAQGKDEDAIKAWTDGATIAGDVDLTPLMAAVTKLGQLAKTADDAHDAKTAAGYRDRAGALLASLADRAKDDPQLARTLGIAYLGAGDAGKAETYLRRAVEMNEADVDARLELARALARESKSADAIAQLTAALALSPARSDIALELARMYEQSNRTAEAAAAYKKLLAAKDVSVAARVHAGRFLAKQGDVKAAAAQAPAILAAEPDSAAGHYLKGEGLLAAGQLDDARQELASAVDIDPDPQYLDAQGRAAEASVAQSGDTKYLEIGLHAYERATAAAPAMFNPLAGAGRIHVARQEWSKALTPLLAAVKLDGGDAGVMFDVGLTYKNLGQPQAAVRWLLSAAHAKPTAEAYWELGQLYQDANDGESTAHAFDEATRLGADQEKAGAKLPWLTDAFYRLGQIEQLLHHDGAARDAYRRYIARNPPPGQQLAEAKRLLNGELR